MLNLNLWQSNKASQHFMVLAKKLHMPFTAMRIHLRTSCHFCHSGLWDPLTTPLFSVSLLFTAENNTPSWKAISLTPPLLWVHSPTPGGSVPCQPVPSPTARPHLALTELSGDRYFLCGPDLALARPQTKQLIWGPKDPAHALIPRYTRKMPNNSSNSCPQQLCPMTL